MYTACILITAASVGAIAALSPRVAGAGGAAALLLMASWIIRRQLAPRSRALGSKRVLRPYGPACAFVTALSLSVQSTALAAALLIAVGAWALRDVTSMRFLNVPTVMLLAAGFLVWLRSPTAATFLAAGVLLVVVAGARSRSGDAADLLTSVVQGLAIYLIVSVTAQLLGFQSPASTFRTGGLEATTGNLISQRIAFPLATSFATTPLLASAFLASLPGHRFLPLPFQHRVLRALAVPAAGYVLIAANYRASLAVAAIAIVLGYAAPRIMAWLALPVGLTGLTLPLWYPSLSGPINATLAAVGNAMPLFSRERANVLSSREVIWSVSLERFSNDGITNQLLGYGGDGHIQSGASSIYGRLFQDFFRGDATTIPPHSAAIQLLFDGGVLGLAVFAVALCLVSRRLASLLLQGDARWLAGAGVVFALALGSATEVGLGPTVRSTGIFWTLILLAASLPPSTPRRSGTSLPAEAVAGLDEASARAGAEGAAAEPKRHERHHRGPVAATAFSAVASDRG